MMVLGETNIFRGGTRNKKLKMVLDSQPICTGFGPNTPVGVPEQDAITPYQFLKDTNPGFNYVSCLH